MNKTPEIGSSTNTGESFIVESNADRLEALAEFAAGAGHEINNPLATIIGRTQLLLKDEQDPRRRQMLLAIGAQAYRIRDMIGDAMLFGRPPLPERKPVDLIEAVRRVIDVQAADLTSDRCTVHFHPQQSIVLSADPTQFAIVINELLRNSRQALQPRGGVIEIGAAAQAGQVLIEVTDHGCGFTDLEKQHAFDPFFSGRQAGRGLGFGLPKIWRIVEHHQGSIEIRSSPSGPTTVKICWPIA